MQDQVDMSFQNYIYFKCRSKLISTMLINWNSSSAFPSERSYYVNKIISGPFRSTLTIVDNFFMWWLWCWCFCFSLMFRRSTKWFIESFMWLSCPFDQWMSSTNLRSSKFDSFNEVSSRFDLFDDVSSIRLEDSEISIRNCYLQWKKQFLSMFPFKFFHLEVVPIQHQLNNSIFEDFKTISAQCSIEEQNSLIGQFNLPNVSDSFVMNHSHESVICFSMMIVVNTTYFIKFFIWKFEY